MYGDLQIRRDNEWHPCIIEDVKEGDIIKFTNDDREWRAQTDTKSVEGTPMVTVEAFNSRNSDVVLCNHCVDGEDQLIYWHTGDE